MDRWPPCNGGVRAAELWNWSMSGKIFIHHFSFIDDITRSFLFSSKWLSVNGGRATAIPRNEGDLRLFDLTAEGHERV
jgi:hypothetical protein